MGLLEFFVSRPERCWSKVLYQSFHTRYRIQIVITSVNSDNLSDYCRVNIISSQSIFEEWTPIDFK